MRRFPVCEGFDHRWDPAHLAEVYDVDVSWDLISKVIDKVVDELEAWRARPLDRVRWC